MRKKSGKRILASILSAVLLLSSIQVTNVSADEPQLPKPGNDTMEAGYDFSEYLETDESGNPYDLGGITVYLYDWFTEGEAEPRTDYERKQAAYRKWVQETYNFTFVREKAGEWDEMLDLFMKFHSGGDSEKPYQLYMLYSCAEINTLRFAGYFFKNLRNISCLHFNDKEQYTQNQVADIFNFENYIWAMSAEPVEPSKGLFFNKRIVEEAGYPAEDIYNFVMDHCWSWELFETILQSVKSVKGKSYNALVTEQGTLIDTAIFSNGGKAIEKDCNSGAYVMDSGNSIEAIEFALDLMADYIPESPEDASWDYDQTLFTSGNTAFFLGDTYLGSSLEVMEDEIGFVPFPEGPDSTGINYGLNPNIVVMPDRTDYDEETVWKIAFAYDQYYRVLGEGETEPYVQAFGEELNADEYAVQNYINMRSTGTFDYRHYVEGLDLENRVTYKLYPGIDVSAFLRNIHYDMKSLVSGIAYNKKLDIPEIRQNGSELCIDKIEGATTVYIRYRYVGDECDWEEAEAFTIGCDDEDNSYGFSLNDFDNGEYEFIARYFSDDEEIAHSDWSEPCVVNWEKPKEEASEIHTLYYDHGLQAVRFNKVKDVDGYDIFLYTPDNYDDTVWLSDSVTEPFWDGEYLWNLEDYLDCNEAAFADGTEFYVSIQYDNGEDTAEIWSETFTYHPDNASKRFLAFLDATYDGIEWEEEEVRDAYLTEKLPLVKAEVADKYSKEELVELLALSPYTRNQLQGYVAGYLDIKEIGYDVLNNIAKNKTYTLEVGGDIWLEALGTEEDPSGYEYKIVDADEEDYISVGDYDETAEIIKQYQLSAGVWNGEEYTAIEAPLGSFGVSVSSDDAYAYYYRFLYFESDSEEPVEIKPDRYTDEDGKHVMLFDLPVTGRLAIVKYIPDEVLFEYNENTKELNFYGRGEIEDFEIDDEVNPAAWDAYKDTAKRIVFNEGITKIGKYTFEDVAASELVFPESLVEIGSCAFVNCYRVREINLPDNLEVIGSGAFSGLWGYYKAIEIPASVKTIEYGAFSGNITEYIVDSENESYKAVDGVVYELKNSKPDKLVLFPNEKYKEQSYTIPEGVTTIDATAFENSRVTHITFPKSLELIDAWAFIRSSIQELNIPETNHKLVISDAAFEQCKSLKTVTLPSTVETIDSYTFSECTALTKVVLSDGTVAIENGAFADCTKLEEITIPASVRSIHSNAFEECNDTFVIKGYTNSYAERYAKTNNITFTSIGEIPIETLYSGTMGTDNPQTWKILSNGYLVIEGEGTIEANDNPEGWKVHAAEVSTIEIGEGITAIANSVFSTMRYVTNVILPDSLESIGASAFQNTKLSSIDIPKNLKSVGNQTFLTSSGTTTKITVDPDNRYFSTDGQALYDYDKTTIYRLLSIKQGETYAMPDTVKSIEAFAAYNENLYGMTLSNNLETIAGYAFGSAFIDTVHIPASVWFIGQCGVDFSDMKKFTVDSANASFTADEWGVLFNKQMTTIIKAPGYMDANFYTMPNTVRTVMFRAFSDCMYISGIRLSDALAYVMPGAFSTREMHYGEAERTLYIYGHDASVLDRYSWGTQKHKFLEIPTEEYKKLTIACPVNVFVYDKNNNLVASVENGKVVKSDKTILVDIDTKVVYLPNSEDYRVEIKATGEGTVTYKMEEVTKTDGGEQITNCVTYNDVAIKTNDTLTTNVSMMESGQKADYTLRINESGEAHPDSVTLNGETDGDEAVIYGHSMTLADPLTLNFYVRIYHVGENDDVSMKFTVGDTVVEQKVYTLTEANVYCFKCPVAAAQATEAIKAVLYVGDTEVLTDTYSVEQYVKDCKQQCEAEKQKVAEQIAANPNNIPLKYHKSVLTTEQIVLDSLLVYCGTAQRYFDYKTTVLADRDVLEAQKNAILDTAVGAEDYTIKGQTSSTNLNLYGVSVVCDNQTGLKLYFDILAADYNSNKVRVTVKDRDGVIDGGRVSYEVQGGKLVVTIAQIAPAELLDTFAVTVADATDSLEMKLSAGYYLSRASSSSNSKLVELTRAMNYLASATKSFFESIKKDSYWEQ